MEICELIIMQIRNINMVSIKIIMLENNGNTPLTLVFLVLRIIDFK